MSDLKPSDLTPTEYLVMEVLAARYRLGESQWSFPRRIRPVLHSLWDKGLVTWRDTSPVPYTCTAQLTPAGEDMFLSSNYIIPTNRAHGG